jgi:hypothetical protein
VAGSADTALTVLEDHLHQIAVATQYLTTSVSARTHAYQVIDWNAQLPFELGEVQGFLNAEPYPEQLHCNASYLSSVAAFEEFLRKALESAIRVQVKAAADFDSLGGVVHDLHMTATGRLLTMKHRPPQQLVGLNFFEVCRKIGTCQPGATAFEFNAEALCLHGDLLGLESFYETLGKFGYSYGLTKLASDPGLRTCFDTSTAPATRKALDQFLGDMTRQRNRIAHTGTTNSQVTIATLTEHLKVLGVLAKAIAKGV